MRHKKHSFHNWNNFSKKKQKHIQSVITDVLLDFILVWRHTQHIHRAYNGSRHHPQPLSVLEEDYRGIHKLFLIGGIKKEKHQQELTMLTTAMLNHNEEGQHLAVAIGDAWRKKILDWNPVVEQYS